MPFFGSRRHNSMDEAAPPPPSKAYNNNAGYADPNANVQQSRKGTLFGRNRSVSPSYNNNNVNGNGQMNNNGGGAYNDGYENGSSRSRSRGFFGSRRRSTSSSDSNGVGAASNVSVMSGSPGGANTRNGGHSILHGSNGSAARQLHNDPALGGARQKVTEAEAAEQAADRALVEARAAVRDARQHVGNLEREVEEEARLQKLKAQEVKSVSKSAKGLGRHG